MRKKSKQIGPVHPARWYLFTVPTTYFSPVGAPAPSVDLPQTNTKAMSQRSSLSGINTLLTRRAKLYTKDGLDTVKTAFKDRFKLNTAAGVVDFAATAVRIDLSSLASVELALVNKYQEDVRGIHFDYGVKNTDFHPVVQFMYANYAAKGDLTLFPERYEVVDGQLEEISTGKADGYTDAYRSMVRIQPTPTASLRELVTTGTEPDPRAEWFAYADNLNKLISDNSAALSLVVSCIAEELHYASMGLVPTPEYRHMLALNMATGQGDLLANDDFTILNGFRNLALDLGHLCPPRCKKVL